MLYTLLLHIHSVLRYAVLILVLIAIFQAITARSKPYTLANKKVNLFALVSAHLQLVIGLILYFISPNVDFSKMSEATFRYWNVEHITMMLVAIALITVGYSKSKKAKDDKVKHSSIYIFYSIALLIVLIAIFTMKDRNPWWNM